MAYHGRLVFTARLQYAKRRVHYPQYIGRTPVFEKEFGVRPTTAINFDSFGHSVGLVQILNQAGYDTYVVCRPAKAQFPFKEQDYLWKGLAGSEVLVHRSDENYNSVYGHVGKNWNSSWKIRRTNRCPCISGASATTAADPPEWI